jgi:hypothetical protein
VNAFAFFVFFVFSAVQLLSLGLTPVDGHQAPHALVRLKREGRVRKREICNPACEQDAGIMPFLLLPEEIKTGIYTERE